MQIMCIEISLFKNATNITFLPHHMTKIHVRLQSEVTINI